jgi:hypothetical protein
MKDQQNVCEHCMSEERKQQTNFSVSVLIVLTEFTLLVHVLTARFLNATLHTPNLTRLLQLVSHSEG